jgi:predicted anti-sigma-YlaC factor YlaD
MEKTETMNCERCHEKLIPYLEASLKSAELHGIEQHLLECASCRNFAEYLKTILVSFEDSRVTTYDPYFYTRVKARIEKQEDGSPVKTGWVKVLQPVAFSLLLMAAVYTGILLGSLDGSNTKKNYAMDELSPLMNEIDSEPLETFLMD